MGCSRVQNTNTAFSCSSVFPLQGNYPPLSKMSPVVPTLPQRSISDRKTIQNDSWGGAHSLSPLGYHLETPNRSLETSPFDTWRQGSATAHHSLISGMHYSLQGTLLYLGEEQKTMCVCIFSIIQLASFCRWFVASFHHP